MKLPYIYKVSIENASRLQQVAEFKISRFWLCASVAGFFVIAGAIGFGIARLQSRFASSLSENRKSAIEAILMLDSLRTIVNRNEAFIRNIGSVLDPSRPPLNDSLSVAMPATAYTVDDLMEKSEQERAFIARVNERERYNVSVLAPLQAEDVAFYSICPEGMQTAASIGKEVAEYHIPAKALVYSPTDAKVVDTYYSPAEGGNVIILQQPRGFLIRIGRLGAVLVKRGDNVAGSEAIAYGNAISGRNKGRITAEMWHNGSALVPDEYLNASSSSVQNQSNGSERN